MENERIENKVILSLEDYLKLRDSKIDQDKNISEIVNLLFNCFELNNEKNDLMFDKYDVSTSRIKLLLKELDPERYQKLLDILKKEDED